MLSWVGAVFMTKGYLSYPQLLQVFNLVLFSLTFGTAMLDFSEA
jgi:ATP-binding cassette subfamily B (MDR/TAP) protein 1